MRVHTYITCIHIHTCTCIHYTYMYMHIIYMHTLYMHNTYIRVHAYTYIHTYMYMHTYMHTHHIIHHTTILMRTHILSSQKHSFSKNGMINWGYCNGRNVVSIQRKWGTYYNRWVTLHTSHKQVAQHNDTSAATVATPCQHTKSPEKVVLDQRKQL